jgi:hypothetical protein
VFTAVATLLLASVLKPEPVNIQVYIAPEYRMGNPDGSCFWISVTMLCKHNAVERGYRIYPVNKGAAGLRKDIIPVLKRKKIKYYYQRGKPKGKALIKWALQNRFGCIVTSEEHALVIVHYDYKGVCVIDNAHPHARKVQRWSHKRFRKWWTGEVLVICPDRK